MKTVRVKIRVTGIVQGVGFRPFIYRIAVKNGLNGYVRNRGDAGVEILLEGSEERVKNFLRDLKEKKPPLARIYEVITSPLKGKNEFESFTILKSSEETELSGSVIPPDIAICDECLKELRDPENPRYEYFFITCTNCGPRYTIIEKLPYDRENTTMREFPMCNFCRSEYTDPLNRRFHAQTVACPKCGPKVYLTTKKGELVNSEDPVREAGKLLSEGFIVAIKGYGGFHVATATTMDEPLIKLRRVKHRKQKPFAIMARSLEATKSFAEVSLREAELLTSYMRPIVLLNKSEDYYLSDLIAPGLHNVGVMLPYTGLHYMLFDRVEDPAFVMTSANPPNQPIIKDDDEALRRLSGTVDYFLFHNRKIAHRCDDSVVRLHGIHQVFLRRSRGYAPAPIVLREKAKHCTVGLGGELNNTGCVLLGNKAFISQHIGDVENVETRDFLEKATKHLIRLTNSKVEAVTCDLHPKFTTTRLAQNLADENGWQLIQVQHHHAHIAALMAEHDVKEIIGISCDGYGYGSDGEAWGGEILFCTRGELGFERLAHLQRQPLIGGDLATRYPLRTAAGILHKKVDVEDWLMQHRERFPHGEKEVEVVLHQLEREDNAIMTTSCGRVLDAVAAVLDVCYERTYEGEPAMKLESIAVKGEDILKLKPIIANDVLNTTEMLLEIFENRGKYSKADLAYSAHAYLAKGLATLAIEKALEKNVKIVGFSGGVACNRILTLIMRKIVEDSGLKFLVHEAVPPGDGGLSFGQAVIVGFSNL
ncbi:carbamoyltransferase HypF [Candidatus Bathyarchaeota archaeon]|nr:MAG: carbamoyltransferase HypF [Candidatus Bathyarchaeota archaeon]